VYVVYVSMYFDMFYILWPADQIESMEFEIKYLSKYTGSSVMYEKARTMHILRFQRTYMLQSDKYRCNGHSLHYSRNISCWMNHEKSGISYTYQTYAEYFTMHQYKYKMSQP
jgi:hypothetical protein